MLWRAELYFDLCRKLKQHSGSSRLTVPRPHLKIEEKKEGREERRVGKVKKERLRPVISAFGGLR